MRTLDEIPPNTKVIIDATRTASIDYDVLEIIRDFHQKSQFSNIDLQLKGLGAVNREHPKLDPVKQVQQVLAEKKKAQSDLEVAQLN